MADDGGVPYLVVSGAPAPEGIPALVAACQAAVWQVVVFSTPTGIRFIDPAALERLTGEPVRYRSADGAPRPAGGCSKGCSRPHCDAAGHAGFRSRIRACEEGVQR